MEDKYHRRIDYARISVTDRCNLRCRYCMPEHGIQKLRREDILSHEEILRIVRLFAALGVRKIRLTGGEPLVRADIARLVRGIKSTNGIGQVMLTTNGVLLPIYAKELMQAGLDGVNMSLDTLDERVFSALSRRRLLPRVLDGLSRLMQSGCKNIKLNCVPLAGINDGDIVSLAGLARAHDIKVRFIGLMPMGCGFASGCRGIPMKDVRQSIENTYGALLPVPRSTDHAEGPATYFSLPGFRGQIGFIDAVTHKFCPGCNRIRLTAEGFLKLCLHARAGLDLRKLLRSGCSDAALGTAIRQAVYNKPREHSFLARHETEPADTRQMYQIGG